MIQESELDLVRHRVELINPWCQSGNMPKLALLVVMCALGGCMSPYTPNPVSEIKPLGHKNIYTMSRSRVCNLGAEPFAFVVLGSEGQETSRRVIQPGETYEYIPETGSQGFSLRNPTENNIEVSVYIKIHGEWTRF